jgi:hypothetical protein
MNYATLKSTVADFLNRDDLTAAIPTFIRLTEAEFNRRLRTHQMVVRADAVIDTQYTALPGDFLEVRSLYLKTAPIQRLEYLSIEGLIEANTSNALGRPTRFTIIGKTIEVYPAPDVSYAGEMIYYGMIPSLTDESPVNWLVNEHFDAYLYGALMQSAPYLKDDARVQIWGRAFENAITQINLAADRFETAGGNISSTARRF